MRMLTTLNRVVVLPALAAFLVGCSGGGGTLEPAPTAPPITADNAKDMAKDINAGAGGMKSPGVSIPKK